MGGVSVLSGLGWACVVYLLLLPSATAQAQVA